MIRKITQESYLICMFSIFSLHAGEGAIKEQQHMIEKITSKLQEVSNMEKRIDNLNTALSEIEQQQKQQKLEKLTEIVNKKNNENITSGFGELKNTAKKAKREKIAETMEAKSKENIKNNKAVREI